MRRVLSSATLRAVPGEVRALVGRNGAGKSTLLRVAAGWMQPDSGTVHFLGRAHLRATLARLAGEGLFFLPDHDFFSSAYTVREQLAMLRQRFGGGADVESALAEMGVAAAADRRPGAMSGGERRRAELAAALVRRPRCLLADEPFRGIAPHDAEVIGAALRRLAGSGCAVVVTGHEVPTLMAVADHVTWCTAGTTYELGAPARAMLEDRFRREYLGPRG